MKRALLLMLAVFPFAAIAQHSNETSVKASVKKQVPNVAARVEAVDPNAVYSNVTNFTGNTFYNGGAEDQGGNIITRLVADGLTLAGSPPYTITGFRFSVSNGNSVAVTVRPRVRFYTDNGGTPGTAIAAFSLPAITLQPNSTTIIESGAISPFVVPTQTVWAGVTFDNSGGTTGATAAQLNLIGQGVFNPVDRGTSTDNYFITTAAGSFLADNPAGTIQNFGGTPPANFGWELLTALPFPVVIEYFKGAKTANGNTIEWKINCTNTRGTDLSIERSSDGRRFTSVYNINVTAAQCAQPFSFIDKSPVAGINYYRLKSTDADGKVIYSSVISMLNKTRGFEITAITPNPVNSIAVLNVASAVKARVQVFVTGLNGSRVALRSFELEAGSNQVELNFGDLAKGSYQLTLVSQDGEKRTARFIKN